MRLFFSKKLLLLVIFLALSIGMFAPRPALAAIEDLTIETGCDTGNLPSYTGVLELSRESYDVYVRLAKRGESAQVKGYVLPTAGGGSCQRLGTLTASGDKWQKIGQFNSFEEQQYVLQLSSSALAGLPGANRPSFMLVPHDNPVCIPDVECVVQIGNEAGFVRPTGTLLNQDSLHVLRVVDPTEDTIKLVRYYVDDTLAYTTPTLQTFDMRYVTYQEQKLSRAIQYISGQRVVIETTAPRDHADNFSNFLFRLSKTYPQTFNMILWGGAVLLVLALVLVIVHAIQRRRDWQYHHGFIRKARHQLTAREQHFIESKEKILKIFRWSISGLGVVTGMITLIVLLNTFVIQIFTVDGHSMEKELFTGDQVLINKLPKTLANINGLEYVPQRGDVVVVRAVFGVTAFSDDSDESDLYLIKRVIGLPGERVVVKDGELTVYSKDYPEGTQPDKGSSWAKTMTPDLKTENLDIQLSQSELFLSGDNRPESIDSRFNGPLATKEVVGKMLIRVWPFGDRQVADKTSK